MLYGTTSSGGTNGFGAIFRVATNGTAFEVLHSFTADVTGDEGVSGLLLASDGWLYATLTIATNPVGESTVFRFNHEGEGFEVLHRTNGIQTPLLEGANGMLYGVSGGGAVFRMNKDGTSYAELAVPGSSRGRLLKATDGLLYGTSYSGGANQAGSIFVLDQEGGDFAVLHDFGGASDGQNPAGELMEGSNGMLYGTARKGGTNDFGILFTLDKNGNGFAILHDFGADASDGWYPQGSLVEGNDGAIYGTTSQGGTANRGVLFRFAESNLNYSILHTFTWEDGDACSPQFGLTTDGSGRIFGITPEGGEADDGAIFALSDSGDYGVNFSFSWDGYDGAKPHAALLEASDGALYGTTARGGAGDYGTVFKVNKDGSDYEVLHNFGWNTDGARPQAGLIEGSDGALYGTASMGGSTNFGTLFKLNKDGTEFTVLHTFAGDRGGDGGYPQTTLTRSTNGWLYGTTSASWDLLLGAIFKIREDGTGYSILEGITNNNFSTQLVPFSRVFFADDGWRLFGTTPSGAFGVQTNWFAKHILSGVTGFGREQDYPSADLAIGSDGAFYGASFNGGTNGYILKFNKDGSGSNVLHTFAASLDGKNPAAGVTVGRGRQLYGTTLYGSDTNIPGTTNGTVFRVTENGSDYEILHSFNDPAGGKHPVAGLTLASDGALYGTASAGGDMDSGTLFSLLQPPVMTSVEYGKAGAEITFAAPSRPYALEATTNLDTPIWEIVAPSLFGSNGLFQFTDTEATNHAARFYRATIP